METIKLGKKRIKKSRTLGGIGAGEKQILLLRDRGLTPKGPSALQQRTFVRRPALTKMET